MKAMGALIWKTWRDLRWSAAVAFLFFLVQSQLAGWVAGGHPGLFNPDAAAATMVLSLGGAVAVLLALALTCRDLSEPTLTFWRSRPIGLRRFLLVKYLSGAVAIVIITMVPILIEMVCEWGWGFNRGYLNAQPVGFWLDRVSPLAILAHSWTLVLVYSVAFALGALTRQAVSAAFLSLAAGLVIYFGPLAIPGLGFLDVFHWLTEHPFVSEDSARKVHSIASAFPEGIPLRFLPAVIRMSITVPREYVVFAGCTLGLSVAAFGLAVVAVRRGIVLALDKKAVCWTLGLTALLFWGGTSARYGSNLPVKQVLSIDRTMPGYVPLAARLENGRGFVSLFGGTSNQDLRYRETLARFDEKSDTLLSAPYPFAPDAPADSRHFFAAGPTAFVQFAPARTPGGDERVLMVVARSPKNPPTERDSTHYPIGADLDELQLVTLDPSRRDDGAYTQATDLMPHFADLPTTTAGVGRPYHSFPQLAVCGNRAFLNGPMTWNGQATWEALLEFDISDPDAPRFVGRQEHRGLWSCRPQERATTGTLPTVTVNLPDIAGLTPRQQLEVGLQLQGSNGPRTVAVMEGDLLAVRNWWSGDGPWLSTYRLAGFEEKDLGSETRRMVAVLEVLDRFEPPLLFRTLMHSEAGQLALSEGIVYDSGRYGVLAYDLRDPRHIRRIGYYNPTFQGGASIAPLPGRRLLLLGTRDLYVLGPIE